MRILAAACTLLLLTACQHSSQHSQAQGSETFGMGAEETAAQEPPPPAGTAVPIWGRVGDLKVPGWEVKVTQLAEDRFRLDLRMRTVINGGDGEARVAFLRGAREIVDAGGYAGFDVMRYEEGIDSGLFFGRRGASGVIRVVESRTWGM